MLPVTDPPMQFVRITMDSSAPSSPYSRRTPDASDEVGGVAHIRTNRLAASSNELDESVQRAVPTYNTSPRLRWENGATVHTFDRRSSAIASPYLLHDYDVSVRFERRLHPQTRIRYHP